MREIKFRAWDIRDERMMYRTVWDRNWYATRENDNDGCHTIREITPRDDNRVELMQYIGEKDKNGVEMYEGDRINVGNFKNQIVSFKDGYFGWGEEHNGLYSFDPFQSETCEVIGNIYEDNS